ncbi:nucleolar zinc-finger protein [Sarracenia purpurea var. burkii]
MDETIFSNTNESIFQSDTCTLLIPELELEVGPATFGGRFSTVEGLLISIKEQLDTQGSMASDSIDISAVSKMDQFLKKLDDVIACKTPFTLILDDPAGNSYAQSQTPPEPDDKLKINYMKELLNKMKILV